MADKSKIEWTDATWNPIRGCSRVSPGCVNCYAERTANRFKAPGKPYEGLVKITNGHPQWTGEVRFVEEHLRDPLSWLKPRMIFANSMSDLFHERLDPQVIARIFAVMAWAWWHKFQVLTKRPIVMQRLLSMQAFWDLVANFMEKMQGGCYANEPAETINGRGPDPDIINKIRYGKGHPLPNVWLGVSVENQQYAEERIPLLLQTPAAVRWLSIEPLLGPVDLDRWIGNCEMIETDGKSCPSCIADQQIHWVVVGGESQSGARPMHPEWPRLLRDQCEYAGIPFLFKQWGEWYPHITTVANGNTTFEPPLPLNKTLMGWLDEKPISFDWKTPDGYVISSRLGKKAAGRLLDGVEYNGYPG